MLRYDFDYQEPSATSASQAAPTSSDLPLAAWRAAMVLLNTPQAEPAHAALSAMLSVFMVDGRAINPKVVASTTVDTGSCRICMSETVLLSEFLLARIWRLQFPLQVTPKSAVMSIPATELQAEPWSGSDDDSKSKVQTFGLADAVNQRLGEEEGLEARVKAFFIKLGLLSTDEVCVYDILQNYQEGLASAIHGEEAPKRTRYE